MSSKALDHHRQPQCLISLHFASLHYAQDTMDPIISPNRYIEDPDQTVLLRSVVFYGLPRSSSNSDYHISHMSLICLYTHVYIFRKVVL